MSKIEQRRAKTAKANIDNKAVLADGTAPKSEFPYKKILIAVLAVVAVIACALLILNAVIDNYSGKFRTEGAVSVNDATVDVNKIKDADVLYDKDLVIEELAKYKFLVPVINNAYANYTKHSTNVMSNKNIMNFVVTINGDVHGEDSNNKLATLMLVSINDGKISFVRMNASAFVAIPGLAAGPLYDSYRFGGAALTAKTIQENYGIAINGYVDLTLDAFMKTALLFNPNGIELPVEGTDKTTPYTDVTSMFEYIKSCKDKEAMVQAVVKSVANSFSDKNILDLRKVADTLSGEKSGMVAYISREDFASLLKMGTSVLAGDKFDASKNVITFGLGKDAKSADYYGFAGDKYYTMTTLVDYQASVTALQTALGYIAE